MNRSWSPAENALDDSALQGGDRALEQGQTGGPRTPGRPRRTPRATARRAHPRSSGQLILVLIQDVDRVAAARANGGRDEPPSIERDHHERRLQRHGRQGVHGDALRSVAVERRHHGHARGEMADDASELVGEDVHPRRIRTNGQAPRQAHGRRPLRLALDPCPSPRGRGAAPPTWARPDRRYGLRLIARPVVQVLAGDVSLVARELAARHRLARAVRLWERDGEVVAWAWLMPPDAADLFLRADSAPVDRRARRRDRRLGSVERVGWWSVTAADAPETPVTRTLTWALDADDALQGDLAAAGFTPDVEPEYSMFHRRLDGHRPLPEAPLPEGYRVRPVRLPEELQARVAVHREAFAPSKMTVQEAHPAARSPGLQRRPRSRRRGAGRVPGRIHARVVGPGGPGRRVRAGRGPPGAPATRPRTGRQRRRASGSCAGWAT